MGDGAACYLDLLLVIAHLGTQLIHPFGHVLRPLGLGIYQIGFLVRIFRDVE